MVDASPEPTTPPESDTPAPKAPSDQAPPATINVRDDLYGKSFVEAEGETRLARADWAIDWRVEHEETDDGCAVVDVATTVEMAYLLPRLVNRDTASTALRAEWDIFIGSLLRHEYRHQAFAVDAAERIERQVRGLGWYPSCASLDEEAERVATGIIENARRREREFDYTTRFGQEQGVVFPSPEE